MHSRQALMGGLLVVLLMCLLVPLSFGASLGPVENMGKQGRFLRVLCDDDGDIHLCYWRNSAIYYYRQNGGMWVSEIVVNGSSTADSRHYPDFAVESNGTAHFIWNVGPILNKVRYNSYNPTTSSWSGMVTLIQTSSEGNPAVCRPAITVCPNGTVYVSSQRDDAYSSTNYLYWNVKPPGGSWQNPSEHICIQGIMPYKPSMDCDSNNDPVVFFSHYNNSNVDLGYNMSDGTGPDYWPSVINPVGWLTGASDGTDIFLDNNNHAHITWIQWTASGDYSKIGYNYRNGPNYNSPWDSYRYLYQQNDIVQDDPIPAVPDPRVAANSGGDICVVYGHLIGNSIWKVRYILKESGQPWPDYTSTTPPKINVTLKQAYPSICVDPTTDDFIVAWEENPSTYTPGTVHYRRILCTPILAAPTLENVSYFEEKIYINWIAPDDPQGILDYFVLERNVDNGLWWPYTSTQNLYYIDEDCWPGSEFAYRVKAVDVLERSSAYSNILSVQIESEVPTLSQVGLLMLLLFLSYGLIRKRKASLTSDN